MEIIKKSFSNEKIKTGIGTLLGFSFFWLTSHPKSPVNKKLPNKSIKNIAYSPNIHIKKDDKAYRIHHWTIFSLLYLPLVFSRKGFLKSKIMRGFMLGSIIQGLTYKDRFNLIKKD
jgi:hypothetical protein